MPEVTNEFSLFLDASSDFPPDSSGPSARTVANVLAHTSVAVHRLGQISDPSTNLVLTVRGVRRGSLVLGLAVEFLDSLNRASPTAHFFVCAALYSAFELMAKKLRNSASQPPVAPKKEAQVAERALGDDQFKFALGAAFEAARSDPKAQIIGIAKSDTNKPDFQLPANYFHDARTGLALPRHAFEYNERIFLKDVPIVVSPPIGGNRQSRHVYWAEGPRLVGGPSNIINSKLLQRADSSSQTPIAVANLEIDAVANRVTGAREYRAVTVRKVRLMPV